MPMRRRSSSRRSPTRKRNIKGSRKLRLIKLSRSPINGKKYRAVFSDGSHTDFGAKGYSDYTKHRDTKRRSRYIHRHARNENWRNMKSAGALSRYILWNKPTLRGSVKDYRRRLATRGGGKRSIKRSRR